MNQTVENQALEHFLLAYLAYAKRYLPKPADPPTDQSVSWHDFCSQNLDFFYTFSTQLNMLNKNHQTVETQGLDPFSKSFSKLLASF
jgi:hypothetical protein